MLFECLPLQTNPSQPSDEFLRDGPRLAAHMTETLKPDGVDNTFVSFIVARVDEKNGKVEYMIERSIWNRPDGAPEQGAN